MLGVTSVCLEICIDLSIDSSIGLSFNSDLSEGGHRSLVIISEESKVFLSRPVCKSVVSGIEGVS